MGLNEYLSYFHSGFVADKKKQNKHFGPAPRSEVVKKAFSPEGHGTYHFLLNELDFQESLFFMVKEAWPLTGTEGRCNNLGL